MMFVPCAPRGVPGDPTRHSRVRSVPSAVEPRVASRSSAPTIAAISSVPARIRRPSYSVRQQRDAHILGGMIRELSEAQYRVLMLLQSTILHYRASAVPSLLDVDVADAAQALAATLESSDRGIIYEPADIIARPTARHCPRGRPREVGEGRRASGRIARRQSRYGGSRPPHAERGRRNRWWQDSVSRRDRPRLPPGLDRVVAGRCRTRAPADSSPREGDGVSHGSSTVSHSLLYSEAFERQK